MATLSSADGAQATLSAFFDQAKRLGFVPVYKLGTVFAPTTVEGRAMVTVDNDSSPTPCFNFSGSMTTGDRVLLVVVPPHGLYILGRSGPAVASTLQLFASTTVYTPPAGLVTARVQIQAGGGAGGGAAATIASQWSFGDGGGGGEYVESVYTAAQLGTADITVTVGAGGTGASGAGGNVGGTSSFALPAGTVTAIGGGGGATRPATTTANYSQATGNRTGGSGGAGGGDIRIAGSPGSPGIGITSATTGVRAGDGGSAFLAGGQVESLNATGLAGRLYGGGGSGAANSASQGAALTGGAGGQGIVIVTSHFN